MKIVYLHIRKCAGSSFRAVAQQNYGMDKVIWDHHPKGRIKAHLKNFTLLGGHFSFSDIVKELESNELVFLTSVRSPIERVISLFNYHIFSDSWVNKVKGFDEDSLLNTIKNCKNFYDLINNDQCYAISGRRTFKEAVTVIDKHNFVIGEQSEQDLYIDKVSDIFSWQAKEQIFSNTAKKKSISSDSLTEEEIDLLFSICSEDYKLYEYIKNRRVFISEPIKTLDLSLLKDATQTKIVDYQKVILKIVANEINIEAGKEVTIPISIENNTNTDIVCDDINPINCSYHIYDLDNNVIVFDGLRTKLPRVLNKMSSIEINVAFVPPINKGSFLFKPSLVKEEAFWFDELNRDHCKSVSLKVF